MDKKDFILIGLAPANQEIHTPVQVQKLFFLLEKNLLKLIKEPLFDFKPYNYGPFDKCVYESLEELANEELVELIHCNGWQNYRLTKKGQERADVLFDKLSDKEKKYIKATSEFVRRLSFSELISSIYKEYPEMKENSVFQE